MEKKTREVKSPKAWMATYNHSGEGSKFCFVIPGGFRPEEFLKRIKKDANLLFVRFATPVESLFAKDYVSEHVDAEFIEDQARRLDHQQSLE